MVKIYKFPGKEKKQAATGKTAKDVKQARLALQPKVLLVVGQDDIREEFASALVRSGCDVTPHRLDPRYYPAELLGFFEKTSFDVVIPTNLGIPFVYVPDMVTLTRKFAKGAGIIVISGWVQDDFVEELARTPRTAFFQSPVDIGTLTATIRKITSEGMVSKD